MDKITTKRIFIKVIILFQQQKSIQMSRIIFLILLLQTCMAYYTLDLSNSILLTNNFTNISTVAVDQSNSYLVGFQDGQARKYSPDFSSYVALKVTETVEKFVSKSLEFSIGLSNGSVFSISSDMTVTLSNNLRTLKAYTYPDFQQIHSFAFSQPILDYQGFSIISDPINPFHVLVFNDTIRVIYNGVITTVFNTTQAFGVGCSTNAVALKQYIIQDLLDSVRFTFYYYHAVSKYGLVQIVVDLVFQYNFTSFVFDMSATADQLVGPTLPEDAKAIFVANGRALIQLNSFKILPYVENINLDIKQDQYIQNNQVLGFFYMTDTYYILFTKGWLAAEFNADGSILMATQLIKDLPSNLYQLSLGLNFDILFIPGTPYIYKAKCFNQAFYSVDTCISYSCTVANCNHCPLTSTTCQTCDSGFTRTDQLTCDNLAAKNNATNSPSSTSNSFDPSANTSIIDPTNSSVPSSNNTLPTNSSFSQQQSSFSTFSSLFPFFSGLSSLYSEILNATKDLASVPSFRRVSPTFYFFANFDDLYLYSYHDRMYGNIMNSLFTQLSDIENAKWSLVGYGTLLRIIGASNTSFYFQIDYQNAYTTYNYQTPDLPSQGSEAILLNCTNFFLVAGPLILIFFLIFRILFHLLFNYSISQLFRKFSIWGYLFITLFDGNIQQFTFYAASEWKNIFFFSIDNKFLKTIILFFGFVLVAVSIGGFLVALSWYRKLNKYLMDNNKNHLGGVIFLLLQYGVRNFLFGMLHSVLRPLPYKTMITILLMLELLLFLTFIVSLSIKIYNKISFMWLYILISFIRILIIFSLAVDHEQINQSIIEDIQCTLLVLMMLVYLVATLAFIAVLIVEVISNVVKLCQENQNITKALHGKNAKKSSIDLSIIPEAGNCKSFKRFKTQREAMKKQCRSQGVFHMKNVTLRVVQVEGGQETQKRKVNKQF